MANQGKAYVNTQQSVPLANTSSGAAGTVLGTERALIHTHANKATLDLITQAFLVADKTNLDLNTAARHTHANSATLAAITAAYTAAEASKLSQLYFPCETLNNTTGSETGLGSGAWTSVLTQSVGQTRSRQTLIAGQVTFRNASGGLAIGYFRVRNQTSGVVYASGQAQVANGQRHTLGFAGITPGFTGLTAGDIVTIDARSDVAANMFVTNVNGLGETFATNLIVVAQGA